MLSHFLFGSVETELINRKADPRNRHDDVSRHVLIFISSQEEIHRNIKASILSIAVARWWQTAGCVALHYQQ